VHHDRLTHEQRDRAESFGGVAAAYDRYRPSYPVRMVDDLLTVGRSRVLDVGCGTGKAARLFAERGVPVLGVEIDPQMATVAREHGLTVEVSRFEDWDDRGRTFDLVTCAQAWHWVDPELGAAKAARVLAPGGELAVFWNFGELAEPAYGIVRSVYRELAPELASAPGSGDHDTHLDRLTATGCFARVDTVTYPHERVWPLDEWIGNVGTQSNHVLLGPRLPGLLTALRTALRAQGAEVRTTGGTYLIRARP
jgi:SAM-dependent methyltransferase